MSKQLQGFVWCLVGFAGVIPLSHQQTLNLAQIFWCLIIFVMVLNGLILINQPTKKHLQKIYRSLEE